MLETTLEGEVAQRPHVRARPRRLPRPLQHSLGFGFGGEREARERGDIEARGRQEVMSPWPSTPPQPLGYVRVCDQVKRRQPSAHTSALAPAACTTHSSIRFRSNPTSHANLSVDSTRKIHSNLIVESNRMSPLQQFMGAVGGCSRLPGVKSRSEFLVRKLNKGGACWSVSPAPPTPISAFNPTQRVTPTSALNPTERFMPTSTLIPPG